MCRADIFQRECLVALQLHRLAIYRNRRRSIASVRLDLNGKITVIFYSNFPLIGKAAALSGADCYNGKQRIGDLLRNISMSSSFGMRVEVILIGDLHNINIRCIQSICNGFYFGIHIIQCTLARLSHQQIHQRIGILVQQLHKLFHQGIGSRIFSCSHSIRLACRCKRGTCKLGMLHERLFHGLQCLFILFIASKNFVLGRCCQILLRHIAIRKWHIREQYFENQSQHFSTGCIKFCLFFIRHEERIAKRIITANKGKLCVGIDRLYKIGTVRFLRNFQSAVGQQILLADLAFRCFGACGCELFICRRITSHQCIILLLGDFHAFCNQLDNFFVFRHCQLGMLFQNGVNVVGREELHQFHNIFHGNLVTILFNVAL